MLITPQALKKIQGEKKLIERKIEHLKKELLESAKVTEGINKKIASCVSQLKKVEEELSRMTSEPNVSEHGMLRYLQNVKGLDLVALKDEILTGDVKDQIRTIGNGKIRKKDHSLTVRNNIVVTVTPPPKKKEK